MQMQTPVYAPLSSPNPGCCTIKISSLAQPRFGRFFRDRKPIYFFLMKHGSLAPFLPLPHHVFFSLFFYLVISCFLWLFIQVVDNFTSMSTSNKLSRLIVLFDIDLYVYVSFSAFIYSIIRQYSPRVLTMVKQKTLRDGIHVGFREENCRLWLSS